MGKGEKAPLSARSEPREGKEAEAARPDHFRLSSAPLPKARSPSERGEGGKAFDPRRALVIRNHIRRLRFEHGEMTQQELAERVGVTRQTVNAIEGAKYAPTLELAFRIANVFGVGVEGVFEVG
jgi:putative transcriptional regulator